MSLLKKNIVANLLGSVWISIISFVFIPVYIKFLGVAAWGLIGIFSTLQIIFSLLDMGLSTTLNREMARLSQANDNGHIMRNLLKTLEYVYWSLALFIGVVIIFVSPFLSKYWINSDQLPVETVEQSLLLMGVIIALQLPIALYSGGFMGLQKQVLLSTINVLISTFRSIGSILILWLVSPTIHAFFLWQILSSVLNLSLMMFLLWRNLPFSESKTVFDFRLLKGIWRFAAGMSGISILGIILSQLDKIVLSKLISLEEFGYYMLANAIAMSLGRVIAPVFSGIYPKFTQLAAGNKQSELKDLYHKVSQLVAILIFPIAIILIFFSYDVLLLWTKNPILAQKSYLIVAILTCGSTINAIMHPPYALQLAFGWTRLSFFKNIIAIIIIVPLIIYLAKQYGPIGAAAAWFILNAGYLIFEIAVMHIRLLNTEKLKWYINDVGRPFIVCLIVAGLARMVFGSSHSQTTTLIYLLMVYIIALFSVVIITPVARVFITERMAQRSMQNRN